MVQNSSSSVADSVHCRRTERELRVREHLTCPYCFGKKDEVASTDHGRFCDFQKGKDPVAFGFPAGAGRHRSR